MKNGIKFLTIIAVIAVIGFAFIACPEPDAGTSSLTGTDPIPVTFTGLTVDGSETQTSTHLTLTFSHAITGLTADDITLSGVSGISKGILSGSGPTYTLGIGGFTAGGTLNVVVVKSGYNISGSSGTVTIYHYTPLPYTPITDVTFSVTADGSAKKTTTQLTLTFSQAITGLTANDITLSGVSGVSKGALSGSGTTYTLKISGFTAGGNLSVAVGSPSGYNVSGSLKTVTVYRYTSGGGGGGGGGGGSGGGGSSAISVTGVTLVPTTLNLTVGGSTENLTATVEPSNATNKALTWSSSDIGVAIVSNGTVTAVAPGIAIITVTTQDGNKTADCTVNVSEAGSTTNVILDGVTADGSSTQTTTELELTFSQAITNLTADDIILSPGVSKGTLSGLGPTYTLPISGFTTGGTLKVTVYNPAGYDVSGSPKDVTIYYATAVTLNSVTANGSSTQTTTSLTLTFDKAITGLAASDITLSGAVTKGTLSGSGPTYTLPISGFTAGETLTVTVAKSGYNISGSPKTVAIYYATNVTLNSVTANGSASQTTTTLTLTFDKAITGLAASDITLTGVTGISKGTITASGATYTLPISGFTAGGNLNVAVVKSGFNISGSPKAVAIYYATAVTLNSVTANGSTSQTTTALTLTFDKAITGLAASDITLSGVSGISKGTLTVSGTTYTLPISGFTSGGNLNVAVAKSGFNVSGSPMGVTIYYAANVTLNTVTANGSTSQTTTTLTLTFSQAITGLSASDITLDGVTGVNKGTITASGTTYTLPISGFTSGGTLNVTVAKSGFNISGSTKTVTIYYATAVTLNTVTANGSISQTTTTLTLTFSQAITGLAASDITLTGVSVTKGTLSGSGPAYTLEISGFTTGGTLNVAVAKSGFNISGSPKAVTIYYATAVTLNSVTANGSLTQTTTTLTLTFSQAISGLAASDITLSGVPSVNKGTLSGSGPAYTLGINGFTTGGSLNVAVAKSGFNVSGSPIDVTIYFATAVTLTSVTANGSSTETTTTLTLTFNQAITGLAANDITLSGVSGVSKGVLSGSGTTYTLGISGFTIGGTLSVAVASPAGYNVSGSPKTVAVYYYTPPISVSFDNVTANGSPTTTSLTLTFSQAITGLAASNITLSGISGASDITKTLSGSGPTYTLTIGNVTASGTLNVTVANPAGYIVSGSPKTVGISYVVPANSATVTITFAQIADAAPVITSPIIIYQTGGPSRPTTATITVSNQSDYSSIAWSINGVTGMGSTFTLNSTNPAYRYMGTHFLSLEVVKNGVRYNKTISFEVRN